MRQMAILTDFRSYDPAYGLCQFVRNEIKMLTRNGYAPRLILRDGYNQDVCGEMYAGAEFVSLDFGKTGSNRVEVDEQSEDAVSLLETQMADVLGDIDIVITHDLIYQANQWKAHVAARRVAASHPSLQWLHVVHSSTNLGTAKKTGRFKRELRGKFPNSRLWCFSRESVARQGGLYGYGADETVVIPPPIDFIEYFHPATREIISRANLMSADVIIVYPCRLDKGKRPGIVIEIAAELVATGYDARVVFANSYTNAGVKRDFREKLRKQAEDANVHAFFTSDVPGCEVCVEHEVIMNLFELGDILIQPSANESYSRILHEAAWHGCGLVLNYDLPIFREYEGLAMMGKFSSSIDALTGLHGETKTEYSNRRRYMKRLAAQIAHQMENNPVLVMHAKMRKERSLEGVWPRLWAAIEGRPE